MAYRKKIVLGVKHMRVRYQMLAQILLDTSFERLLSVPERNKSAYFHTSLQQFCDCFLVQTTSHHLPLPHSREKRAKCQILTE